MASNVTTDIENKWQLASDDERWADLDYVDTAIANSTGQWKISIGGNANQGVNRYQVAFGTAESPGSQFRQNTVEDHRISNLVMRVVIKGDYPNAYLKWASTFVNVPFVDGSHPRQVDDYIAIDCADTCLKAWIRAGHSVTNFQNESAQSTVDKSGPGKKYTSVLAPTEVYPETDADPAHKKWSQITRPQPGDLIIWDWPYKTDQNGNVIGPDPKFDHATIYVGTDGGGATLAADGSDKTIYAGSRSFNYRVKSDTYKGLWDIIQSHGAGTRPLPVRITIIRLQ